MNHFYTYLSCCLLLLLACQSAAPGTDKKAKRPNILLAISDDQSWLHTSAYGYEAVQTPAFDRIAKEGVLFTQAFAGSPGCSPSRASLLTGRNCWELEHAGTHASQFSEKYHTYPDLLEAAGYWIGHTGKGWGPGNYELGGRTRNPAGPAFQEITAEVPEGIRSTDYAANFEAFLKGRKSDQPFCFWYGSSEPHRVFKKGIGIENGGDPDKVVVPAFLPDRPEIRSDILDYAYEIEWFDSHLARMIAMLEELGELDNTIIIVTSDNGMAFPRAKANVYEYGIHMPLAIRWGSEVAGNRVVNDLVDFPDIAPTILEAAAVNHPGDFPMSGQSLVNILTSGKSGIVEPERTAAFSSRERHSSVRYKSLGYPQRAIRTHEFLYIRNFKPERWPAGAPQKYGTGSYAKQADAEAQNLGPMHGGYHDIDGCPSLDFLIENREDAEIGHFLELAVGFRPAEEMFDIRKDPACLNNLAANPAFAEQTAELRTQLETYLKETGDARMTAEGDIWETYPRYSRLRLFPTPQWAIDNPESIPDVPWVETHLAKQYP